MESNLLQAAALGLIQGLTEFIPVSSSGHLQVIPNLLGWEHPTSSFIWFVHLGTLISLLVYFRKDMLHYAKTVGRLLTGKVRRKDEDLVLLSKVGLACIPAALIGLAVNKQLENFYDNPAQQELPTVLTLAAMAALGVVFVFQHKLFPGKKYDIDHLSYRNAVLVGLAQALAFFRGVSRSGITLLAGQALGMNRVAAAKFSFLMSIPIIGATSAAGAYQMLKLPPTTLANELLPAGVGMAVAAISGYLAIDYLLNYLRNNNLQVFGWYRIIFAAIGLALIFSV